MQSISSLASGVSKAVWGEGNTAQQQSGEEPKAGETGTGTSTQPYDAGNSPDQHESNTGGAANSASVATTEAASAALNADRPGNARKPSFALKETATGSVADTSAAQASASDDQLEAAGRPLEEPVSTDIVKDDTDPNKVVANANEDKNKAYEPNVFDATKDTPSSPESSRLRTERTRTHSPERSVSPGARPDGSHAETGKAEKTKLSTKLKGKLHIGSSKH